MVPKFNPGDRVVIARKREDHWNNGGLMDHWLGKVMTIREHDGFFADIPVYHMMEDTDEWPPHGWSWTEDCLELADQAPTLEEADLLSILEVM